MKDCQKNRETISTIGDLVEALFNEVSNLPLSDEAKTTLVMIMMGDVLKRNGKYVYLKCPPKPVTVAANF